MIHVLILPHIGYAFSVTLHTHMYNPLPKDCVQCAAIKFGRPYEFSFQMCYQCLSFFSLSFYLYSKLLLFSYGFYGFSLDSIHFTSSFLLNFIITVFYSYHLSQETEEKMVMNFFSSEMSLKYSKFEKWMFTFAW